MLGLLFLLALPVLDGAALGRFQSFCEETVPEASCTCVADRLQDDRDGRVMIETVAAMQQPEAARQDAMLRVLNRYGLRPSELKAIAAGARSRLDSLGKECL